MALEELSWQEGSAGRGGRWKKFFRGKSYYFSAGRGKSDRAAYRAAQEEWAAKKGELMTARGTPPDYEEAIKLRQNLAELYALEGSGDKAKSVEKEIAQLRYLSTLDNPPALDRPETFSIDPVGSFAQGKRPFEDGGVVDLMSKLEVLQKHKEWKGEEPPARGRTVGELIAAYLAGLRARVGIGDASVSYYSHVSDVLKKFEAFVGGSRPVEVITAALLTAYRAELMATVERGALSRSYGNAIAKKTRAFIRWLEEEEVIERTPKNIRKLTIKVGTSAVPVWTIEQVQDLLSRSKGKRRIFWLLMLNCGFTQIDIANLRDDEVDWKAGTIRRKRTKTRDRENVPVVTYQLWPETLALLRQYRSGGELVLTGSKGRPLMRQEVREGGGRKKYDAVARAARLLGVKNIKELRKTSCSMFDRHDYYARYAEYFLGEAPSTMMEKHYGRRSDDRFFEALAWLRQQYLGDRASLI